MQPTTILCLGLAVALLSAFVNHESKPSGPDGGDERKEKFSARNSSDTLIPWADLTTDTAQFGLLRSSVTAVSNAKTIAVRFSTRKLIVYLQDLETNNIDSVDVYLGKYVNASSQPSTGTPISLNQRGKLTVVFAGTGTSAAATPSLFPYNVGNPWP